jgi:hypothetical protein
MSKHLALCAIAWLAACETPPAVTTIGPAGGTVTGPRGASVVVPPGALSSDTAIAIALTAGGAPPLPAGVAPAGATFEITPHGQMFALPVTLTVPFDAAHVTPGTQPMLLKTTQGAAGPWDWHPSMVVEGALLQAQVTSFSYVTAGSAESVMPSCSSPPSVGTLRLVDKSGQEMPRDPLTGMYVVPPSVALRAQPIGFMAGNDSLDYDFDAFWQGPEAPPSVPNERGLAKVEGASIDYFAGLAPALYGIHVHATTCGGSADSNIVYAVGNAPSQAIYRTSANNVQTFTLGAGAPSLADTDNATPHGGSGSVGVAFNGQSLVVRTSAGDVQSYSAGTGLMPSGVTPSSVSGNGAAIAAIGTLAVRATAVGLETLSLAGGKPALSTPQPITGSPSTGGVAVDVSARFAVRAHDTGIDVYDVKNASAPTLIGSATTSGGQVSNTGVGVSFARRGELVVRSGPVGIDVFTLAADGKPSLAGSYVSGVASIAVNTAVAVDDTGTRAVRAHASGIEIYDLSNPAAPQRIGQRAGTASTTGVGVQMSGTRVVRTTNVNVEVYDVGDPANIGAPAAVAATPSSVGVGLTRGLTGMIAAAAGFSLP